MNVNVLDARKERGHGRRFASRRKNVKRDFAVQRKERDQSVSPRLSSGAAGATKNLASV